MILINIKRDAISPYMLPTSPLLSQPSPYLLSIKRDDISPNLLSQPSPYLLSFIIPTITIFIILYYPNHHHIYYPLLSQPSPYCIIMNELVLALTFISYIAYNNHIQYTIIQRLWTQYEVQG
eukprot:210656_1